MWSEISLVLVFFSFKYKVKALASVSRYLSFTTFDLSYNDEYEFEETGRNQLQPQTLVGISVLVHLLKICLLQG